MNNPLGIARCVSQENGVPKEYNKSFTERVSSVYKPLKQLKAWVRNVIILLKCGKSTNLWRKRLL